MESTPRSYPESATEFTRIVDELGNECHISRPKGCWLYAASCKLHTRQPRTTILADEEIQRQVLDELKWDPEVEPTDVGVEVDDGVVTLPVSVATPSSTLLTAA
jgi:osmotically-inducible protein OsmY